MVFIREMTLISGKRSLVLGDISDLAQHQCNVTGSLEWYPKYLLIPKCIYDPSYFFSYSGKMDNNINHISPKVLCNRQQQTLLKFRTTFEKHAKNIEMRRFLNSLIDVRIKKYICINNILETEKQYRAGCNCFSMKPMSVAITSLYRLLPKKLKQKNQSKRKK
ncbi:hypothetical protein OSB04_011412 [Centaurea solstitialis]|uniref:Uncharacterized protein n=1 Tax=Centaurea solstitialis TaxID=347529 RepID=A0AA38T9D1_9ASTR|nr:hypothetical protein OSB04_011412 [Centaurea solstitialis]